MPIEGHFGFQAKGVSCSQARRQQIFTSATLQEMGPNLRRELGWEIDFKAIFSCISSPGDKGLDAVYFPALAPIILDGSKIDIDYRLQNLAGVRALNGQLSILVTNAFNFGVIVVVLTNPFEVPIRVGSIDANKIIPGR